MTRDAALLNASFHNRIIESTRRSQLRLLIDGQRKRKNCREKNKRAVEKDRSRVPLSRVSLQISDMPYMHRKHTLLFIEFSTRRASKNEARNIRRRHPLRLLCTCRQAQTGRQQEAS